MLVKGTGTREWLFSYDFLGNDGTDVLLLDILKDSFAAINCQQECRAWNWNGAAVDLSVRTFDIWLLRSPGQKDIKTTFIGGGCLLCASAGRYA